MNYKGPLHYYRDREDQERMAAARALCQEAKIVHLQLADRYADQCWSLGEGYRLHLVRSDG